MSAEATTGESTVACDNCGELAPQDATWCEACGHELGVEPKPACVSCGEREVDVDEGYCLSCGYRQPRERDHLVVADGPLVAISDRGRRHHHNEDSVALGSVSTAAPPADHDGAGAEDHAGADPAAVVLVVCDGVSSTPGSAEASAGAAIAARDHVVAGLTADPGADLAELLTAAVAEAQAGATAAPEPDIAPMSDGPPSSTLVVVVARPSRPRAGAAADGHGADGVELTTAWVGDSRAYWVGDDDARRLGGPDHELGGSLVRWLGADSLDPTPDIDTATVTEPGHLVVCTDGLWRYADEPAELAEVLRRFTTEGRAGSGLAEALVDHANELGGHDNITVALWSNQPGWPPDTSTHPSIASAAATEPER